MCLCMLFAGIVFFFKQKAAYEMRISDWSSDVCSSDLNVRTPAAGRLARRAGKFRLETMTPSDGQGGDNSSTATGKSDPQQSAGAAAEAPALAIIEAFGGIRPMAKMPGLAVWTGQGGEERSDSPANRYDQPTTQT